MITEELRVVKKTGTYADALVAVGLADLVQSFYFEGYPRKVRLVDEGNQYVIKISPGLSEEEVLQWQPEPGYVYIQIRKTDPVPQQYFQPYDYESEREIEKSYREFQKALAKKKNKMEQQLREHGGEPPHKPKDDLPVIKTFNSMRMGSNAYNQLFLAITEAVQMPLHLAHKITKYGFQHTINTDPLRDDILQKAVSTLQLFNPVAGKGVHRPKPDSSSPGSITPKLLDWFEEWMKFRSMHLALLAYYTGNDGKDTKVMVISPGDIDVRSITVIRNDLLKERLWGSTLLDIKVTLSLAEKLIRHSEEFKQDTGGFKFGNRTPKDIISGIYTTYFKNLGTASAVINVSFLGLPGWFKIKTFQDAEDWLAVLSEHWTCLQTLDEGHSDDVALLLLYRDFISTGDYRVFLDFLAGYGSHLIQCHVQNKYARAFTTLNLRRILMSSFQEIIENEGFLNLATAIRKATINPQIRKSKTGKPPFEIQYGLAQNWKRKAKYKEQFIVELADFVQRYNAENAKHMELKKETRKNITTEDLNQVFELIHKHSSELVGMLLLAYGYAKEPREDDTGDINKNNIGGR